MKVGDLVQIIGQWECDGDYLISSIHDTKRKESWSNNLKLGIITELDNGDDHYKISIKTSYKNLDTGDYQTCVDPYHENVTRMLSIKYCNIFMSFYSVNHCLKFTKRRLTHYFFSHYKLLLFLLIIL